MQIMLFRKKYLWANGQRRDTVKIGYAPFLESLEGRIWQVVFEPTENDFIN